MRMVLFFLHIWVSIHHLSEAIGGADSYEMLKAAEQGNIEVLMEYLKKGVPLNTKNNFGVSAIIFAANNGHCDAVLELIKFGANIEDVSNNGRTPLIWASWWGHRKVVETLVENKANISAQDYDGITPLMSAVYNDKYDIIEYLLLHNASVSTKNVLNGTAISIAQAKKDEKTLGLLITHSNYYSNNAPEPSEVLRKLIIQPVLDVITTLRDAIATLQPILDAIIALRDTLFYQRKPQNNDTKVDL